MAQQVNQQIVIDELIRRVNSLTIENIVLSAQLREQELIASNHTHGEIPEEPPTN